MNNKNFTIISDGSCDLPDEIVKEKDRNTNFITYRPICSMNQMFIPKQQCQLLTIMLQLLKKKLLREMILFVFA